EGSASAFVKPAIHHPDVVRKAEATRNGTEYADAFYGCFYLLIAHLKVSRIVVEITVRTACVRGFLSVEGRVQAEVIIEEKERFFDGVFLGHDALDYVRGFLIVAKNVMVYRTWN